MNTYERMTPFQKYIVRAADCLIGPLIDEKNTNRTPGLQYRIQDKNTGATIGTGFMTSLGENDRYIQTTVARIGFRKKLIRTVKGQK